MPELKNPRWEKFCRVYLDNGFNAMDAYRKVGYKEDDAGANSSRLMRNPSVKQRMIELRAKAYYRMQIEREELTGFLGATVMTPAGKVTKNHPLCQSYESTEKGVKVRMPDKVAAAQALARMAGWDAPQQVEITVNPLTSYLRTLRSGNLPTPLPTAHTNDVKSLTINDSESNP